MTREAIAALVHRYADAVSRRDEAQWAATWAPDAIWQLAPGHSVTGRDAIVELWLRAMGGLAAVVQMVANGEVHVDGDAADVASGRWYVHEHLCRLDGRPGMLLGYYDDTYVRGADGWLFSSRILVAQYQGPPDLSAPFRNRVEP